jgi:hypothetical protein
MTDSIAPPPELVLRWEHEWNTLGRRHPDATNTASYVATRAAQWGADRELEACCQWLCTGYADTAEHLRTARRPQPSSLKLQALAALYAVVTGANDTREQRQDLETIRRALEALPND